MAFAYAHLSKVSLGPSRSRPTQRLNAENKRLAPQLFLYLSQACLGKMIIFMQQKWLEKALHR